MIWMLAIPLTLVKDAKGPVELLAAFVVGNRRARPVETVEPCEWCQVIGNNLTGTFVSIRATFPARLETGRGLIVTMPSAADRQPCQAAAA